LALIDSWLTHGLNGGQKQEIQTKADNQKKNVTEVNAAKASIQQAAKTLQVTAIVVYHANNIGGELAAMQAILDTTPSSSALPFGQLNLHWNNVKGELTLRKIPFELEPTSSSRLQRAQTRSWISR
jgi:hypothetical protein